MKPILYLGDLLLVHQVIWSHIHDLEVQVVHVLYILQTLLVVVLQLEFQLQLNHVLHTETVFTEHGHVGLGSAR